jgi:RNA polymerase sigma-70 factor (ECF subfamily)
MAAVGPIDEGLASVTGKQRTALLERLLGEHRARLLRMVDVRLHPQVRARVDASDVVQEAYMEASRRIDEYAADPRVPFFVWLRRMTGQRLLKTHRTHLDAQQRDVRRQAQEERGMPEPSVVAMVARLAADGTTPTRAAARAELRERILTALGELGEIDREVLSLRHFEGLTNEEVAAELDLTKHAASKRYIRALERLREVLGPDA